MNILLTINENHQAMLVHDRPLGFHPAWVEFSRDMRGVRIISMEGKELKAGLTADPKVRALLDPLCDILLVRMENQKPAEGFKLPFINQYYDGPAPKGVTYVRGWTGSTETY